MGDGVLLYPGRQRDRFGEHSVGLLACCLDPSGEPAPRHPGRGLSLAGARAHRAEASAIARALLPRILAEANPARPS